MVFSKLMQPILVLAIAGVAVGALGVGFLDNGINLTGMVQQFGVGEATIGTPITQAYIDFVIDRTTWTVNDPAKVLTDKTIMRNVVSECIIQGNHTILKGSKIFCKLTDLMSNVVAEGSRILTTQLPAFEPTNIIIDEFASGKPSDIDVTNIHDVILVVQGPSQLVDP